MAEIIKMKDLLVEKEDVIKVSGVGVFTYKTLKKNVEKIASELNSSLLFECDVSFMCQDFPRIFPRKLIDE